MASSKVVAGTLLGNNLWCMVTPHPTPAISNSKYLSATVSEPLIAIPEAAVLVAGAFSFLEPIQSCIYNLQRPPTASRTRNSQGPPIITTIKLTERHFYLRASHNGKYYSLQYQNNRYNLSWGFTYGFGFAVFVSSIGQPGFYNYFKLNRTSISLHFSIY